MADSGALYPNDPSTFGDTYTHPSKPNHQNTHTLTISHSCILIIDILVVKRVGSFPHGFKLRDKGLRIYTWRFETCEERSAIPQSDRWGLSWLSNRIFPDLKLRCTTAGRHTSCKYLHSCYTGVSCDGNLQGILLFCHYWWILVSSSITQVIEHSSNYNHNTCAWEGNYRSLWILSSLHISRYLERRQKSHL